MKTIAVIVCQNAFLDMLWALPVHVVVEFDFDFFLKCEAVAPRNQGLSLSLKLVTKIK